MKSKSRKPKENKVLDDIYNTSTRAILATIHLQHYIDTPAGKQQLIDSENEFAYVFHVRDLYEKVKHIMELISESDYAYLLNDD